MNARQHLLVSLSLIASVLIMAAPALADPLLGRDLLKFEQQPMDTVPIGGAIYSGHDELSTAYAPFGAPAPNVYRGTFMADDFADTLSTPVVHVKWWGSYLNNFQSTAIPVNKFLIAFEEDHPQGPNDPFSYPIPPIFAQIVNLGPLAPNSGTYTEKLISPGSAPLNEQLYEYNAELRVPFPQKADVVQWLKIVALVDVPAGIDPTNPNAPVPRWGWHNRDYTVQNPNASPLVSPGEKVVGTIANTPIWHFQDDAVTGVVNVFTGVNTAGVTVVQQVDQPILTFRPTNYLDNIDGPQGIRTFSKDLAFALYTQIPEPATCMLMAAGLLGIAALRRLRR